MALDEVADRLYAVPPARFVAERTAAVAAAKEAGDTATAATLAKLRRPTVAAWLVNLLALRRPELVTGLAELAEALRDAQRDLDGERLRELTGQRRATVSALVAEAAALARAEEPEAKLPLAEVEATLTAALADPAVAETVRSGRLIRQASAAEGLGELPKARLRVVDGDRKPGEAEELTGKAAEAELAAARTAAEEAQAALARAEAAQREAKETLAGIDAELAELQERRAEALQRVGAEEAETLGAKRAEAAARRRLNQAEAAVG
jgi:hypothetical protein